MANKRRDKKNRILKDGEYQAKDGRYSYRYYDIKVVSKVMYSWKLVDTDLQPKGTRKCKSLRAMEAEVSEKITYGIDISAAERTLDDCYNIYMKARLDLKRSSRETYAREYNTHVHKCLGHMKIGDILYSHIRMLYIDLIYVKNLNESTVGIVNAVLEGIFTMQMRDMAIKSNPVIGVLKEVVQNDNLTSQPVKALTIEQQAKFVDFYTSNRKYAAYVPMFTVLLGTEIRIGECLALTWDDIDWENNEIIISNTYATATENGKNVVYTASPKSKSSIRRIQMFSVVRKVLEEEYKRQEKTGYCTQIVNGRTHFIISQ